LCGAFGVTTAENIIDRFNLSDPFGRWEGSYNIRPMQQAPLITKNSPLKGHLATFGFIPSWSKEAKPKLQPINAKAENVAIPGFFKAAFLHTRCLLPAEFYYEWQKMKQPYTFKVKEEKVFSFAGIYSEREDAEKKKHYTFAIITTKPNKVAAEVHDRMPVILHREDEETWLDKEADPKELMHLLRPYDGELISWKVGKEVGNVRNDGPDLIKPI
jgi:putative SOS response-associated peptidase YedK